LVFAAELRTEQLAQGDVLEEVEFFAPRKGEYREPVRAPGLITSHSCDFTKFLALQAKGAQVDRAPLLVAPLLKGEQLNSPDTVGNARAGKVARYVFVGDEAPLVGEHFADFWFMQPVAVLELLDAERIASMTDSWQRYLQRALDRFFSWEDRKALVQAP
jgi:hypothetical protein